MDQLRRLGLQERWIYEVLISTFRDDTPHAAPIGVWTNGADELLMDVYDGSRTLANILEGGQFVANFPLDAGLLYTALRAPQQLAFAEARFVHAPVVAGCTATVELTLSRATPGGDRVRIVGDVKRVHHAGAPRLINRAEGLLLESLVLATRLEHREAAAALTTLTENHRVVGKVAPGSAYERALAALLRDLGLSS
ncbi:MAG: DUF447 family protein [Actinobacteria bacterium]|nr:DUF447 family protein [Actinomycetota bacterium]